MKLATFRKSGIDRLGVMTKNGLVDLAKHDDKNPHFASMQALIEGGDKALNQAQSVVDTKRKASLIRHLNGLRLGP